MNFFLIYYENFKYKLFFKSQRKFTNFYKCLNFAGIMLKKIK